MVRDRRPETIWAVITAGCIECIGGGNAGIKVESVHTSREDAQAAALATGYVHGSDADVSIARISPGEPLLTMRAADAIVERLDHIPVKDAPGSEFQDVCQSAVLLNLPPSKIGPEILEAMARLRMHGLR
jgi:hypothetical protein